MVKLLKWLFDQFGDGLLKRLLESAGLTIASSVLLNIILSFLIDRFLSNLAYVGDISWIIGISGFDQSLSIIISALFVVAQLRSTNVSVTKK
ncbi:DUF2523 family protein [Acinetobacter nectaris]|uniref:DUF2523 family protein n=1 Tax=Acinetobacter nectaris TaxID=1219382 RepID=UPI001F38BCB6|nr:DUF2523 family protein [Acinetobacter nectaris]MCF9045648.1 DUF2523 domain-containing protein [Acinetobacter nectaris]